ncbi:hypothetical protein RJ640_027554, partial [Escallonia rubra]
YVVLAPWVVHSMYSYMTKDERERDLSNFLIFPFLWTRMLHNQIWISLSRYITAKGKHRIVDKSIEFEQIDRERDWDDQILFNGILFYLGNTLKGGSHLPFWRTDAVIHPFAEHIAYFTLFAIPLLTAVHTGTASVVSFAGYISYIDLMNNMGHCNFELVPKRIFCIFPPLKYLMYTPSFHSLHHTQFRTNYSLFMPFYDYVYGTVDKATDRLHITSLLRQEEPPNVVHLTHLTTPESIYHTRLGFASLASRPYTSKWYLCLLWPVTFWSIVVTWIYGKTFVVERNMFKNLKLQTWAIPKYKIQYFMQWQRESINNLIEKAVLEAEERGTKVLSLGLLNQGEELNGNGELYIRRHPELKVKLIDGSSLAVAVVLNSIPKGTTQVALRGNLSKVAYSIAFILCRRGIQVATSHEDDFTRIKETLETKAQDSLVLTRSFAQPIWLVGDGLSKDEQLKASKGTIFIPFSQFPPKKVRKDCFYYNTPAMLTPKYLENVDSCENWLPRRVMSAWRIAGILHALEGWNVHECGNMMFNIDKVWQASLQHGFLLPPCPQN